jgi:hypothetical protein
MNSGNKYVFLYKTLLHPFLPGLMQKYAAYGKAGWNFGGTIKF